MTILVTGGAGYIGSHTVVQLLDAENDVLVLDNLGNSKPKVIDHISKITGKHPTFIEGDVRDAELLQDIFSNHDIQSVIHFAGLKSVAEGGTKPLWYYDNNVAGSVRLFEQMANANVYSLVFSSSATVYGEPVFLPYTEAHPHSPMNVYGHTKLMVEQVLRDLANSNPAWRIALLRYFNPVGAHHSGLIGEDPSGVPNNLMPFVAQVAVGKREKLSVFGDDYETVDGTGVRDYIHVDDLASGHLAALDYLKNHTGILTVNLGTGKGTSVFQLLHAFEKASGKTIPYEVVPRRSGDLPEYYAQADYAKEVLGWKAKYDVDRMCEDTWRWQSLNPNGFES
jgi:UDP-glucose 4-epimerase